jgi:hypothetical protein
VLNYENATKSQARGGFRRPKAEVPSFLEEEDDYSLIESQLEKSRRLKLI